MTIHSFSTGPFATNCYIVADETSGLAFLIDAPPESSAPVSTCLTDNSYQLTAIILTHGHWDHFADAAPLKQALNAPVWCHRLDEEWIAHPRSFIFPPPHEIPAIQADRYLVGGDMLRLGKLEFVTLHVPGHSMGHIALSEKNQGVVFAGDLVFYGSIGRTDFPGGDYDTIMQSIESHILCLPDETKIYTGHGPVTTVGFERAHNPFIIDYLETKSS